MTEVIGYDRAWYLRKKMEPGFSETRLLQVQRYQLRCKLGKSSWTDYYLFALDALELVRNGKDVQT